MRILLISMLQESKNIENITNDFLTATSQMQRIVFETFIQRKLWKHYAKC